MKLQIQGDTLRITEVPELGAANSATLRDEARSAMSPQQRNIEIDLSQTHFLDSCGLGVLIALHKTACSRRGMVRLLNPTPVVQQVLTLTHMDRIFDITTA
jgi:anti-sigma B factor antagonist